MGGGGLPVAHCAHAGPRTASELTAADAYEVSDYRRVEILLKSGRRAWAYVKA
jgi:hypothetical protein